MKRIILIAVLIYLVFTVVEQGKTIDDLSRRPAPGPTPTCNCGAP